MSMWSYVIFLKTRELAQQLVGKRKEIDFVKPQYATIRQDSSDILEKARIFKSNIALYEEKCGS